MITKRQEAEVSKEFQRYAESKGFVKGTAEYKIAHDAYFVSAMKWGNEDYSIPMWSIAIVADRLIPELY